MTINDPNIQNILNKLDSAESVEDYTKYLQILAHSIPDKKILWSAIHTERNSSIRLTINQLDEIFSKVFPPECLFNLGFESFTQSELCEGRNFGNEESIVDVFYALAGFIRACHLPDSFIISNPDYLKFISTMLKCFLDIPDFEPNRFVWLVEVVSQNLRLDLGSLKKICQHVIEHYIKKDIDPRTKFLKLSSVSTSPFLRTIQMLGVNIKKYYDIVVNNQRLFIRKYILSGLSIVDFGDRVDISDPIKCWILFIDGLYFRTTSFNEYPSLLLLDAIDESLNLFVEFYPKLQLNFETSASMRLDIFCILEIIETRMEKYSDSILRRCWMLLLTAAASGSLPSDLESKNFPDNIKTPTMGVERNNASITNVGCVLNGLRQKFEKEPEIFFTALKMYHPNAF